MAIYTDFFLLAVPKGKLSAYRKLASEFGKVAKDYGALAYREFVQDTVDPKTLASLGKSVGLKKSEVVIFSYIHYSSKASRNSFMKKMMTDPRLLAMSKKKSPADMKRMIYAGFKMIYEMKPKK